MEPTEGSLSGLFQDVRLHSETAHWKYILRGVHFHSFEIGNEQYSA